MKNKLAFYLIAIMGIIVFVFPVINKSDHNCINLYIDYGPLNEGSKLVKCVDASSKTIALDILKRANFDIEGTQKYGLSIVCRVNGLPDRKSESCETMPSEKSYWAIIIKEKQTIPFPRKEWGWGQLAINQQYLSPGDSLGLVFADNGNVRFP